MDWKWYTWSEEAYNGYDKHLLSDAPARPTISADYAEYSIGMWVPDSTATLHLRVRSAGGGYVSKGFYVTPGGPNCG